ncbi:MAG: hypothetical protein ACTHJ4_05970 [Candidatus Nucleicultricaceae bacterium]
MTLTYRLEKGSALSYAELDQNFKILEDRIADLSAQIQSKNMPKLSIQMDGLDLVVEDQFDRTLARLSLPIPQFKVRGTWQAETLYQPLDIVSQKGIAYLCRVTHRSSDFKFDQEKFSIFCNPLEFCKPELVGAGASNTSSSTLQLPMYSASSLPKPSVGQLVCIVQSTGRHLFCVSLENEWHVLSTQSTKKREPKTSKVSDASKISSS